jgi:plasmid maintenance system killer protein
MVEAYWNVGKKIVEVEQDGETKAKYGSNLINELSKQLTAEFGKGFTQQNLRNMRQFYLNFPNRHTLCSELSWSHYRLIMRIENEKAREYYIQESIASNWSVRAMP